MSNLPNRSVGCTPRAVASEGRLKLGRSKQAKGRLRHIAGIILTTALLTGNATDALADPAPPPAAARTEDSVEALALQWFAQMRAGQIDRTQLTAGYSTQLTNDAVQGMSRYLNEYKYGAAPTGARVLQEHAIGDQTFYVVKLIFPRGDAASLLFGFDAEGKITGISLMSMAGD